MAQFDLQRFVDAQEPVYDEIRTELTAGTKTSHWMWFAFPQLQGLGRSAVSAGGYPLLFAGEVAVLN